MDMITYNSLASKWVENRTKENLANLREFLDNNGCRMPRKLFHYSPSDKSTWLYIDCLVYGEGKRVKWIVNHELLKEIEKREKRRLSL